MDFIIRDFQSIEEAKISVRGLTLLLGQTSSGKSAAVRAIQAACTNRFKQGQVREGQDQAVIKVRTPESDQILTVIRPYGGSIKYQLGNQTYEKVARSLPQPISEFLNFASIEVGSDSYSLNFHPQFQKPLLLDFSNKRLMDILSASKELDRLNELKDAVTEAVSRNKGALRSVDSILTSVKQELSSIKEAVAIRKPIIEALQPLLLSYEDIQDKQVSVKSLEALLQERSKLSEVININTELVSVASSLTSNKETQQKVDSFLDHLKDSSSVSTQIFILNQIVAVSTVDTSKETYCNKIFSLLKEYSPLCEEITYLTQLSTIKLPDTTTVNTLYTLLKEPIDITPYQYKVDLASKLVDLDWSISDTNVKMYTCQNLINTLHSSNDLGLRIKELTKITEENICPICGNKMCTHGL